MFLSSLYWIGAWKSFSGFPETESTESSRRFARARTRSDSFRYVTNKRIGLRFPVEVGLVGDSRSTLRELIPLLRRKQERGFLQAAQAGMKDWWEVMEQRATRRDKPMKPQVVAWELGKRLRADAIVSCDSGTIATWWARQILAKRGQMHTLSGTLATMAPGLPYTIAAQVAFPSASAWRSLAMADFPCSWPTL